MNSNTPASFVERLAERVIVLEGWQRVLLAICAGAVSALSLAPYHVFPLLIVTLPLLVWLMDGAVADANRVGVFAGLRKLAPAFKIGWCFGFGYFLAGFWWVGHAFLVDAEDFAFLLPIAVVALPAGLALFWGLAMAVARLVWSDSWTRIVALAASLTLFEWLRGTVLTGLPWNVPGYAAMPTPVFMQTASLIGLYGVTFLTLFVAAAPAIIGTRQNRPGVLMAAAVIAVAHVSFGLVRLAGAESAQIDDVKLRIVQPALDQNEKWDSAKEAEIMGRYFGLSNANKGPEFASVGAFTHVIWPESAFPFILSQRGDQLANIARLLPPTTSLITGAMRMEQAANADEQPKVFNSLYVINGDGETVVARDKVRLLPFGEFLPFQEFLEGLGFRQLTQLRGGFAAGSRRAVIDIPGTPAFLPLICYEIIFSGQIRAPEDPTAPQPRWIVNLTNDAWFGMTAGPYQHAHQAQLRAVEEGLPVIRAANNGISFISDAYGRIEESLALGQRGVVDGRLPASLPSTLFSRTGNMPVLLFICLMLLSLVVLKRKSTTKM
ncbi:MAG: apolipoprotein N-acyltransferase [Rhizobiaceae bacterium]